GLPLELRRSVTCTNIIENMNGTIRQVCRNVKYWQDASMALRWTSAAMCEAPRASESSKLTSNCQPCEPRWPLIRPSTPAPILTSAPSLHNPFNQQRPPSKFQHSSGHPRVLRRRSYPADPRHRSTDFRLRVARIREHLEGRHRHGGVVSAGQAGRL